MKNLSRMITHREREARAVESALAIHAELGADGLAAFFADVLEDGETSPDWGFVFELLRRKVSRSREQMLEAERLHRDEITNDRIPRARRDALVRELRRAIIDWRQVLHSVVGKDKSIEIGFVTPLTRDPRVLVRTANVILGNLERSMKGELEFLKPGVRVDLAVIVESIRVLSDELAAVIEDLDLARRALERSVLRKQEALRAFDELFPRSSRLIEALFTLCGEDELAKRVRPSVRRMVRPEAEPEETVSSPLDPPKGTVSSPLGGGGSRGPSPDGDRIVSVGGRSMMGVSLPLSPTLSPSAAQDMGRAEPGRGGRNALRAGFRLRRRRARA